MIIINNHTPLLTQKTIVLPTLYIYIYIHNYNIYIYYIVHIWRVPKKGGIPSKSSIYRWIFIFINQPSKALQQRCSSGTLDCAAAWLRAQGLYEAMEKGGKTWRNPLGSMENDTKLMGTQGNHREIIGKSQEHLGKSQGNHREIKGTSGKIMGKSQESP